MNTLLYVFTHLVPLYNYVSPPLNLGTFYDVIPSYFDYHCSKERFFLIVGTPNASGRLLNVEVARPTLHKGGKLN
jgi:hypothetical protein